MSTPLPAGFDLDPAIIALVPLEIRVKVPSFSEARFMQLKEIIKGPVIRARRLGWESAATTKIEEDAIKETIFLCYSIEEITPRLK